MDSLGSIKTPVRSFLRLRTLAEKQTAQQPLEKDTFFRTLQEPEPLPALDHPRGQNPSEKSSTAVASSVPSRPSLEPGWKPSVEELREKMFAVHATDTIPSNGFLKAGAQHRDPDQRSKEPASFRPTIHFALGELVRPHGRASWEDKPFAVVLPLKSLEPQMTNLAPHDTFIVGDFRLPPGAIFLAPEGTQVDGLPEHVEVRTYQGVLRDAVDRTIADQEGWSVRMQGVSTDDPARMGNEDINSPDFFASLLKSNPGLSFGSHISSEVGEAYRFGQIEQSLVQLNRQYEHSWALSTPETHFYRALIEHSVTRLKVPDHPAAKRAVEEKVNNLREHLKVVDADLAARGQGLTLVGACSEVRSKAIELASLGSPLGPVLASQLKQANDSPVSLGMLTEALHPLPPDELKHFIETNPSVFKQVDMGAFQARYAVKRWLEKRDDKEGLESLLYQGFEVAQQPTEVMRELEEYLEPSSYRSDLALSILRRPAVKQKLVQEEKMSFSPEGPRTILEAIQSHPEAAPGLGAWNPSVPAGEEEALSLLRELKEIWTVEASQSDSFRACRSATRSQRDAQRSLERSLSEVRQPLRSAREARDILAGDTLSLYERLQRRGSPPLGLTNEIWTSRASLLDHYLAQKSGKPLKEKSWLSTVFSFGQ